MLLTAIKDSLSHLKSRDGVYAVTLVNKFLKK